MQERLVSILAKIEKLIALNENLKNENTQLKTERDMAREVQSRLKKDLTRMIEEKENTPSQPKIDNFAVDNLTKKEIKAKIDQYISEIDNCIAQIEKL